jgi:two-component system phosphate regulon sensor histidine kinase PhoR
MLFVAHAVHDGDSIVGALQMRTPTADIAALQRTLQRTLVVATALATLAIVGLMVFQAERAAQTVHRLTDVAERITAGELSARIMSYSSGDIGQLARAFNRMASNLEALLRTSERETDRLNTVMYAMNDGVLIVNKSGKVELINRGATRLLSTTEANALDQSFVQVVRDHRIVEVWQRSKTSGGQETDIVEGNNNRSLQIVATPLLRGADRGHLVIVQDLTRIRQLQTIRQDFVSNVSHELRTPLAALRALVETLRDGALEDPPAARRFLDRMESEVDALTQMVQELLELSRIESGQAPLRLQNASVAAALGPGIERLRMQAERAGIHLSLDLPPGLPSVIVDVDRIQQVVTNLVHNAIKFTPPGGFVTVSASADADMVTVAVRDTGVGIPPQDVARIFERFYKADRARAGGGTGLGLAIAKHIVHAHEGEIWVQSEQGGGSCFYFTLPQTNG